MAKTVFRPGEAKIVEDKVMLPLYKDYSPVVEEPEVVEEVYTGPTADDLRREAEAFKEQWEAEKNQMFAQLMFMRLSSRVMSFTLSFLPEKMMTR